MEVEIRLEPGRKEPRAVIYAGADTPELQELAQRLSGVFLGPVPAFRGERAVLLEPGEVYRFYTDGKGVSAQTEAGVYAVRLRLYELEERLGRRGFLRVSHSPEDHGPGPVPHGDHPHDPGGRGGGVLCVPAVCEAHQAGAVGRGGGPVNERRTGVLLAALGGLAGLLLGAVLWGPLLGEGGAGQPLVLALGQGGAGVVLLALCAALGATVGTAALPFAGDGPALVVRSLAHFALTALEALLLLRLCFQVSRPDYLAGGLGILALLYLLVWLGRYVGWYWEVADLRRRLGLSPGPSPLKWRETLPYLPLLALICVAAPLLARWVDGTFVVDVPVFSGLLLPFAVLPAAGFCSGFSLGRREGFCPLYPLAGGLLYVPAALIAYNHTALFHSLLFALPALAGNAAGGAWRRIKRK